MGTEAKLIRAQELQSNIQKLRVDLRRARLRCEALWTRFRAVGRLSEEADRMYYVREQKHRLELESRVSWYTRLRMRMFYDVPGAMRRAVQEQEEYVVHVEIPLEEARRKLEKAEAAQDAAIDSLVSTFAKLSAQVPHIVDQVTIGASELVAQQRLECVRIQKEAIKARRRLSWDIRDLALWEKAQMESRAHLKRRQREKSMYKQMLKAWKKAWLLAARNVKMIKIEMMRMEMEMGRITLE